jgi:hypothetical protein
MAEILNSTAFGNHRAFAQDDMTESTLFTWATEAEYIRHCTSGERPIGITLEAITEGQACGDSVAFFEQAGKMLATVHGTLEAGDEVESDGIGQVVIHNAGYAFGQVIEGATDHEQAKIYVY